MGSSFPHASAPSTASQENVQSSHTLLDLSDQRTGPSVGTQGSGNCIFLVLEFRTLAEGPSRELLSPGVTSNESVSTLEPSPVAGAIGEGQAWIPGSHLPRACEMASSAPPLPPIPSPVSGFLSVCTPQGGEGWLISDALWRRAPRPLGALRSDPRGLRVISPAHPERNPTLDPALLSSAASGKT